MHRRSEVGLAICGQLQFLHVGVLPEGQASQYRGASIEAVRERHDVDWCEHDGEGDLYGQR